MGRLPNKFAIPMEGFRRFTFAERLKILCGYNIELEALAVVNSRLGSVKCKLVAHLSREITPQGQVRASIREEQE